MNMQAQYEHIEKRLEELRIKAGGEADKLSSESDYFREYEKIMDEME